MNDRETRRYDMFGRVKTFGTDNATDFAAGGEAQKRFTNVAKVITDLDAAKAAQQGSGTTAKEVLLDALRLDLQNISRTARAIAQDTAGFADTFRPPDSPSQTALLTTADAFLAQFQFATDDTAAQKAAKTALIAKFVAHELPADFVTDLSDDRKAIDAAEDAVESDDSEGVESTAAVGRLIKAGMKEVNYLDAIMRNKYTRNPDKLRAWDSASHIERAPQREKKPAPNTPGSTPPK